MSDEHTRKLKDQQAAEGVRMFLPHGGRPRSLQIGAIPKVPGVEVSVRATSRAEVLRVLRFSAEAARLTPEQLDDINERDEEEYGRLIGCKRRVTVVKSWTADDIKEARGG